MAARSFPGVRVAGEMVDLLWSSEQRRERFFPAVTSPRAARGFVADALVAWGLGDLLGAASTIASELSTNAVLHGRTPFEVCVARRGARLRIAVTDSSPAVPIPHPPGAGGTSGRGLAIVASLAREWGVDLVPGGKTVWAELGLPAEQGREQPAAAGSRRTVQPT